MTSNPLMEALQQFDATEANLVRLERIWTSLEKLIPTGIVFGDNPEYETLAHAFGAILVHLPMIDGWRPSASPPDLDSLAQQRLDAEEIGELEAQLAVERWAEQPGRELRRYRLAFNAKRRAIVRDALVIAIAAVDEDLQALQAVARSMNKSDQLPDEAWLSLRGRIREIETLIGSAPQRPDRWSDLRRHAGFGYVGDLNDIVRYDWPSAKKSLLQGLHGDLDPVPVSAKDLGDLVEARPRGQVVTKLSWSTLTDEAFERLIFQILSSADGYENPEWLTQTRAPDRGRDLSVTRVIPDSLAGVRRERVIIQCKHWQKKSVALTDLSDAVAQMALWTPPAVDCLIVATSGRFSSDAVRWVEVRREKREIPSVEIWAESHLERLLAERPWLISEYQLR